MNLDGRGLSYIKMPPTDSAQWVIRRSLEGHGVRYEKRTIGGYETSMMSAGDGPTTLLWFPALGDSAGGFGSMMVRLVEAIPGITIMAIDPPGYGDSVIEDGIEFPTFDGLTSWIATLTQTIAGPLIATGNSSGAQIAAMAGAAAPFRLRGSIFVAWPDFRFSTFPSLDLLCPRDDAALDELWTSAWHSPPRLPTSARTAMLRKFGDPRLKRHAASWRHDSFATALASCPPWHSSSRAFIGGSSDKLVPPSIIEQTAALYGAKLYWIASAGHFPHREQPALFVDTYKKIIHDFLGG